ncbi:MAG: dihydrodipicolinate reductase [Ferruginibacter sp.]|nr:dihydrodipicolinate reductase [Ferruginibacter sp.]
MNIALIGYGKMGQAIEVIALEQGHSIGLIIRSGNQEDLSNGKLQSCDVAIEFTNPESAVANIRACLDAGVPVVCGSTGWYDQAAEMEQYCRDKKGSFLYASNFSIGVNIFFEVNKRLAELMSSHPEYKVQVEEIHHTAKKDAPSGTAISLAEQILPFYPSLQGWTNSAGSDQLPIISRREDPAPGTHHVRYQSEIDDIEIIHTAHSRKGFAAGAVLAASFISGRKGIFSMKDVLNIK